VINGFTPDGLIALHGGGGTLSEVAYALHKKKPVVFLESRDALRASRHELSGKLTDGYAAFRHLLLESLMTPNRAADYPDCPDDVRKALDALLG